MSPRDDSSLDDPTHAAIAADLRSMADVAAPADLARSILAAADRASAQRTRRLALVGAAVAFAAAVVIYLVVRREEIPAMVVGMEAHRGTAVVRGTDGLKSGDRLVISGTWLGRGELRLYHDDHEVIFRCTSERDPGCRLDGDQLLGTHIIDAGGSYRVVLIDGTAPTTGNLQGDLAAATGPVRTSEARRAQ